MNLLLIFADVAPDPVLVNPAHNWAFLCLGYLATIAIETPVLLVGLSRRHPWSDRLLAGLWLTACTYPIVAVALPLLIDPVTHEWRYLAVAETFAHVGECALFWLAYGSKAERWKRSMWQDLAVVFLANSASFLIGKYSGLGDFLQRIT